MIPKYKKDLVYEQLSEAIASRRYAPGEKFPKELDFARQLGVSFITLRAALAHLQQDGLIVRIPGKGTFVSQAAAEAPQPSLARLILVAMPDLLGGKCEDENVFNKNLILGAVQQGFIDGFEVLPVQVEGIESVLQSRRVAGVIWDRPDPDVCPVIQRLKAEKLPQVTVNRHIPGLPAIASNYVESIRIAMRFLRSIGHRHVALIDHSPTRATIFQERQEAFLEQLQINGVDTPEQLLLTIPVKQPDKPRTLWNFMRAIPDATAIIVQSPFLSHVHRYLEEERIGVPRELSVIQWGEIGAFHRYGSQPYTLLTDPRDKVGILAVKEIARALRAEPAVSSEMILVNGELMLRQGCAAPRGTWAGSFHECSGVCGTN